MKTLLWMERHFAWLRWETFRADPCPVELAELMGEAADEPLIDHLYAQASRPEPRARTRRTVLVNIATSVGTAILIGMVSGILTAERVIQGVADTLKDHEARIHKVEETYVPISVHAEKDAKVKDEFKALGLRVSDTEAQVTTLQSQINMFLLMQAAPVRVRLRSRTP